MLKTPKHDGKDKKIPFKVTFSKVIQVQRINPVKLRETISRSEQAIKS
jgi:hypothetical protein